MLFLCVLDPTFRRWKDAAGRAEHEQGADCYKEGRGSFPKKY